MMRIEKIEKKDERNVTITFEDGEKLYLAYDIFLKNGLRKNEEISESRFALLIEENQKFHLKQKAFTYLGRRLHSAYELKIKLRQKGYNPDFIAQVVDELKSGKYVNDYEFASLYADENIRNKLWGRKKLEAELFKKGIDRNIIAQVADEKFPAGSEFDKALELGGKKIKSLKSRGMDNEKLRTKLISFLITKGYDYDVCRRVTDTLIGDSDFVE
ncbi:MAG: RecX family transcriptional regulator [Ignavibacteriaceae bacterium]|nr:RecX family transcriptional regulator [Ignavibacteriaceae bacterium]